MYVFGQPPKGLVFTYVSDVNDNNAISLLLSMFIGSKHLPLAGLHVSEKWSFNLTKYFVLDIELSAVLDKTSNSVYVALAIDNKQSWISKDQYWALLYTLPGRTTAHDLSDLLMDENYDGCIFFSGKTWAQVASGFFFLVVSFFPFGTGLFSGAKSFPGAISSSYVSALLGVSNLYDHLVSLECSLELLANQISSVMKKLNLIELVPLLSVFRMLFSAVSISLVSCLNSDMVLNNMLVSSVLSLSAVEDNISGFSSNSSKILTTKMGGLELKMVSLEALINLVLVKLDCLCSDLGALLLLLSQ
ncbi:hypothetical protein G9A89_014861 [Geosiphon pyriformis]|nr:hypothetical protein G9A89_014861 [Geosiphon pyriformis]